jgi:curved DNA-binding protein CbpA
MNTRARATIQVGALHEILGDLDYYRLLQLEPDARQADIDTAYRRESRRLHPDRFAALSDEKISAQVADIHRLITEAHAVLKDPDARIRYDRGLKQGAVRLTDDAGVAGRDGRGKLEEAARTPKGEKYWRLAITAWESGDFQSCIMQIQFALSFEPDNEVFKEWIGKAKSAREESGVDEKNAYKIRLVR